MAGLSLLAQGCLRSSPPPAQVPASDAPLVSPSAGGGNAPTVRHESPQVRDGGEAPEDRHEIALGTLHGLEQGSRSALLEDELKRVDPRADNAEMEAVTEEVLAVLGTFGRRLEDRTLPSAEELRSWMTSEVALSPLRPGGLQVVFDQSDFRVLRWSQREGAVAPVAGLEAARGMLAQWAGKLHDVGPPHFHFKVVRADLDGETVSTSLIVQAEAHGQQQRLQQTANWECRWQRNPASIWMLQEARVTFFEEVVYTSAETPFVDVTKSVLGRNACYEEQFLHGNNHWRSVLDWRLGQDANHSCGLSLGDVTGDGLDDVYICQPGGLPNRLFARRLDGTVDDISAASGTDILEPSAAAIIADFDNDGDQDLIVASGRYLLLFANDGAGRFERRGIITLSSVIRGLAAADYDLDGDVDVYACGYFSRFQSPGPAGLGFPIPYHDANNGGENSLLRNDGNLSFTDVTEETGLARNNSRFSYVAGWEDYDRDGDPDLYVANDFGRSNLFRNDGGKFVDVAAELGVEDISAGMSVSWGDFDRDGLVDLYKGNMFSTAGNRVTYNRSYGEGLAPETLEQIRRHARGNSLFRQRPDGRFEDVSIALGVTMGRWAWCSSFVDLNNDGWEDILVLNGMVTGPDDTGDL